MNTNSQTPVLTFADDEEGGRDYHSEKYTIEFNDRGGDFTVTQKATGLSFTQYRPSLFSSLLKNTKDDFGALFHKDESPCKELVIGPLEFTVGTVFIVDLERFSDKSTDISGVLLKAIRVCNNSIDPENCLIEYEFVNEADKERFKYKDHNCVNSSHVTKIISLGTGTCLLDEEKKIDRKFPKHIFMKKKEEFEAWTGFNFPINATKRHRFISESNLSDILRTHSRRIKIDEATADLIRQSVIVPVKATLKGRYSNIIGEQSFYRLDMPKYKVWLAKNVNKFLEKRIKVQVMDYVWFLQDQLDNDISFGFDSEDKSYSYNDMLDEQKENRNFFERLTANGKIVHASKYRSELATGRYEYVFGVFKDYYFLGLRTSPIEHLDIKISEATEKVVEIMTKAGLDADAVRSEFKDEIIHAIKTGGDIPEIIFKAIAKSKA